MRSLRTRRHGKLEKVPPDVAEAKSALDKIGRAGFRANEVLANVPTLFQYADDEQQD